MKSVKKKQVIIKPIITEKTLKLYNDSKIVTFLVECASTKKDIAYHFEQLFNIRPEKVNVLTKRFETSTRNKYNYMLTKKRKMGKKAYIYIGENKLDIFENIK